MKSISLLLAVTVFVIASCSKDEQADVNPVVRESYTLPGDTVFPEGIAYRPNTGTFYTGSTTTGDILSVKLSDGQVSTFSSGSSQGRKSATGLKIDNQNRLWVCGGADNKVQVLGPDGSLLRSWDLGALFGSGFINDCIFDTGHIYFTDSRVRKIYRTSIKGDPGPMEEWLSYTDAQIPFASSGTNTNGIVVTPDSRYLMVVVSSSGKLYRIDKTNKAIQEIALNTPVTSGDGLYLDDHKLYVSRNATNLVFPVDLNSDYTQGTVGAGFGNNLTFNTTMARVGAYFLVVNGQLDKRNTGQPPLLPFTVSRIAVP